MRDARYKPTKTTAAKIRSEFTARLIGGVSAESLGCFIPLAHVVFDFSNIAGDCLDVGI